MNDLQAQLEESNKEKQELQEKVGTLGCPGSERELGVTGHDALLSRYGGCFSLPPVSRRAL